MSNIFEQFGDFLGGAFKPSTEEIEAKTTELPQTGYSFVSPYAEDYSRRLLSAYFGDPLRGIQGLISQPRDIPIEGTAGLDPLETRARELAGQLGEFRGFVPEAADLIRQEAQTGREGIDITRAGIGLLGEQAGATRSGLDQLREASQLARDPSAGISQFMNPFEQQVVQQTIEDITKQSAMQGVADRARAVGAGAFGGSRGRLQESEREEALGRGLLKAVGDLRSRGFEGARESAARQVSQIGDLGQAMGGLGANLGSAGLAFGTVGQGIGSLGQQIGGAGQSLAGIGQLGQSMLGTKVGTLERLGATGRGIDQAGLTRRFRAADVLADEPFARLQRGQQLLAGMPIGGISGGTGSQLYQPQTFQTPSAVSQLAGLAAQGVGMAGMAGAFGSDIELKENVRRVGDYDDELGWYEWDWNEEAKNLGIDAEPTAGFLAQEVLEVDPHAVTVKDGYYAVDYGRLMS